MFLVKLKLSNYPESDIHATFYQSLIIMNMFLNVDLILHTSYHASNMLRKVGK